MHVRFSFTGSAVHEKIDRAVMQRHSSLFRLIQKISVNTLSYVP